MKLHTVNGSPNSHRVLAVIEQLGLEVEIVHHDIRNGALRSPEYVALNPNAMVPTLVDGDFVLWEANAITQYLADKAGSESLFPREPRLRADIVRWQFWELVHFNRAFGALAFETVAKPTLNLGPADETVVAKAQADLARFAPVLDGHLAGRRHVVGNSLTLADYSVCTFESYTGRVPFDWAPYPNIRGYFERMRKVEAWARTASPAVRPVAATRAA
jgi:glutathione S-transferase